MPSDDGLRPEIATIVQSLEASERQFRAVFESAPDAMVVVDDEGRFLDANPAACALYGRSREEIQGARIGDFSTSSVPTAPASRWSSPAATLRPAAT